MSELGTVCGWTKWRRESRDTVLHIPLITSKTAEMRVFYNFLRETVAFAFYWLIHLLRPAEYANDDATSRN